MTADEQGPDTTPLRAELLEVLPALSGMTAAEAVEYLLPLFEARLSAARTERDTAAHWQADCEEFRRQRDFAQAERDELRAQLDLFGENPREVARRYRRHYQRAQRAEAELAELRCTANILAAQRDDAQVDCEFAQAAVVTARRDAWDEGLEAGRDRWMDNREFGVAPVNPYRARASTQTPAAPSDAT